MQTAILISLASLAAAMSPGAEAADQPTFEDAQVQVRHRTIAVDGVEVFYREAGPTDAPVVMLLHGFPSSSFMFRNLIPRLAGRYRVIAPDYPGFGQSAFPDPRTYSYTFETLANTMHRFASLVGAGRYALYVQDYGAPIGFRMALKDPERVSALIVQNGNAYEEGLSAGWAALKTYWREPTASNREALRAWLTREGIREQYVAGTPAASHERFAPETWTLDWALLQRPGAVDVQLDLFGDYRSNVELYPAIQRMFRLARFPTLIVWGKHDVFFTEEGARAYRRDLPDAELHWLDAGHFALETHHEQIASLILEFLGRKPQQPVRTD
jgi:pimeloyl-ACP methyl ester carboxylesterase